jgi:hypothetical protein
MPLKFRRTLYGQILKIVVNFILVPRSLSQSFDKVKCKELKPPLFVKPRTAYNLIAPVDYFNSSPTFAYINVLQSWYATACKFNRVGSEKKAGIKLTR